MAKMILGVFADKLEAEHAVDELVGGALSGTTTGGVIGGLTGLLIGTRSRSNSNWRATRQI